MTGRHGTVGQDLVNHCVNDILVQGAVPLFFLDYLAAGKLEPDVAAQVVEGVATACRENGCALIGGETAEMPGFYQAGEYDMAGFIVGVVERDRLITGERLRPGDALIGLRSTGLHTNGYSLARAILFERLGPDASTPWCPTSAAPSATNCCACTDRTCRSCGRCSRPASSRAWRTSPAAASPRTCRGSCRRARRR